MRLSCVRYELVLDGEVVLTYAMQQGGLQPVLGRRQKTVAFRQAGVQIPFAATLESRAPHSGIA
jgi:hypothetical protein